ncbi:Lipopolysaccharide export system ATP-binding protein LptB [Candidatus Calditenuaceae archaeon HR02]|nr:Lipopolysaccharide export system ATP-binding protein LptB [Candidatus Calditenuaceae archaeon HR02]
MQPRPLLSLQSVSKSFDGVQALAEVSLELSDTGILGVIGPNGAGKSTLAGVIVGSLRPDSGRIFFLGREITGLPMRKRARLGIANTHQIPRAFPSLTVYENLELAVLHRADTDPRRQILETAELLGLQPVLQLKPSQLSHGQIRLVEISMALLSQPRLLVMDEPTQGLTGLEVNTLTEALKSLGEKISIIVIDHRVDFVASLSPRIAVMHRGRILALGSPRDSWVAEKIEEVYLRGGA